MLAGVQANQFAKEWIEAWNGHDLERILVHYADDIVFSSPFVKRMGPDASGLLRGREALRKYFEAALTKFPALHFHLRTVLLGVDTVTLLYDSVNGLLAAETMTMNDAGRITRVWAQYDRVE
jgi:ketosteroid isomerase-like protein